MFLLLRKALEVFFGQRQLPLNFSHLSPQFLQILPFTSYKNDSFPPETWGFMFLDLPTCYILSSSCFYLCAVLKDVQCHHLGLADVAHKMVIILFEYCFHWIFWRIRFSKLCILASFYFSKDLGKKDLISASVEGFRIRGSSWFDGVSLMSQQYRIRLQCRRHGSDPWVG